MRWMTWWRLLRGRSAKRAAARAAAVQDAERLAALQRTLDAARNEGPGWNGPTRPLPLRNRPLLTRGQEARAARRAQGG